MALDKHGHEVPDQTPMAIPAGFKKPETLAEQVQRLVRSAQLRELAESKGFETFDEANDFDVPDDPPDPSTPFEPFFDPVLGHEITAHDVLTADKAINQATKTAFDAKAAKLAAEKGGQPPATPIAGEAAPPSGEAPSPE